MGSGDALFYGGLAWLPHAPAAVAHPRRVLARVSVTARGDEDNHAAAGGGELDVFGVVACSEGGAAVVPLGAREMGEVNVTARTYVSYVLLQYRPPSESRGRVCSRDLLALAHTRCAGLPSAYW